MFFFLLYCWERLDKSECDVYRRRQILTYKDGPWDVKLY